MTRKDTVVMVGAGNIGSHLVEHLARLPGIGRLVVIDRDRYEPRNRRNQAGAMPGRKATVQARRARAINPDLDVIGIAADVERIPAGLLRANLVVSGVDNRRARVHLNQLTRWLGVPWIDAGVMADGGHARLTRLGADPAGPCLTCGWGPRDFALIEQRLPCVMEITGRRGPAADPATGTSSGLGALAASLAALEAERVLADAVAPNRPTDFVISADRWQSTATAWVRNPHCPTEHAVVASGGDPVSLDTRVADLVVAVRRAGRSFESLGVLGARFVGQVLCSRCGLVPIAPRVLRAGDRSTPCQRCGRRAAVVGAGLMAALDLDGCDPPVFDLTLAALGCATGDLLSIGGRDETACLEVLK
jgi:molybdopterin/thiamine biosynthesis adenylyltransferase